MQINGRPARVSARAWATVWRDLIRLSVLVLVVTLPLVVMPWGREAYSYPKILVLYALVATMLVGWVAGLATGAGPTWKLTLPEIALWGFLLAVVLSSGTSVDIRATIFGALGRSEGLLAVVAYVSLYFFGAHFFGDEAGLRRLAVAAGAAALGVIAYGLLQIVVPPLFEGELLQQEWYSIGGRFTRVLSTLGSPNVYGGYLSWIVPLMAATAAAMSSWGRRGWLLGALLGYVSIVVTMSRGAWAGALAGSAVFMMFLGRAELWRLRRFLVGSVVGVGVVAALLLRTIAPPETVVARAASAFDAGQGSLAQHLYIWERTLGLIQQRPILGWGLETLRAVFPYDRPSLVRAFGPQPVIIDKAHNDILQVAVSVGIPGAVAYLAFWLAVAVAGLRVWRRTTGNARLLAAGWLAGVIGYLVHLQFLFSTVAVAPLVWLFAGACAGWEVETRTDPDGRLSGGVEGDR